MTQPSIKTEPAAGGLSNDIPCRQRDTVKVYGGGARGGEGRLGAVKVAAAAEKSPVFGAKAPANTTKAPVSGAKTPAPAAKAAASATKHNPTHNPDTPPQTTAREAALMALMAAERERGRMDEDLRRLCAPLSRRDAALARQICYGVVQKQRLLDLGLEPFIQTKIESSVANILRMGAYQCWFLDRVPRHAIVNEAVNQARRLSPKAAGLCNAILRRLPDAPPVSGDPAVNHSIPPWLFGRFTALLGQEETLDFLRECDSPPPLTVHQNPQKPWEIPPDARPHPGLGGCFTLTRLDMDAVGRGELVVADEGARLCVAAANPQPGERVWDTCAAPGGKTALMALQMEGRGLILATETVKERLPMIRETVKRLGLTNVRTDRADARFHTPDGLYDLVLCDVPCSGFGVLRRKPDIRFRREMDITALPLKQAAILQNAAKAAKPGGRLVYCTCTVLPEENAMVVDEFLQNNKDFHREAFTLPGVGDVPEGQCQLWPHRHGTDGFFIAKLRKGGDL